MASATATVARESGEYRARSTFLQSILYLILTLGAVVAIGRGQPPPSAP